MTTLAIVLVVGTPIAFAVAIAACAVWERIWLRRNESGSSLAGWLIPLGLFVLVAYFWPVVGR